MLRSPQRPSALTPHPPAAPAPVALLISCLLWARASLRLPGACPAGSWCLKPAAQNPMPRPSVPSRDAEASLREGQRGRLSAPGLCPSSAQASLVLASVPWDGRPEGGSGLACSPRSPRPARYVTYSVTRGLGLGSLGGGPGTTLSFCLSGCSRDSWRQRWDHDSLICLVPPGNHWTKPTPLSSTASHGNHGLPRKPRLPPRKPRPPTETTASPRKPQNPGHTHTHTHRQRGRRGEERQGPAKAADKPAPAQGLCLQRRPCLEDAP